MSRFPLTSTPARTAMLARCMFGNGTRQDDTALGSPDPQDMATADTGPVIGTTDPAAVRPRRPRDCATSG